MTIQATIRQQTLYFNEGCTQSLCDIVSQLQKKGLIEGTIKGWDTGGGVEHLAVKMNTGKWVVFHNLTEDITQSKERVNTIKELMDKQFEDQGIEQTLYEVILSGEGYHGFPVTESVNAIVVNQE